eukprot:3574598-Rhodomonas_salina.2
MPCPLSCYAWPIYRPTLYIVLGMRGTEEGYGATRSKSSPLRRRKTRIGTPYAFSRTGLLYAYSQPTCPYAMSGTEILHGAADVPYAVTSLRARYAISVTEILYGATRLGNAERGRMPLPDDAVCGTELAYGATRCAVLSQ